MPIDVDKLGEADRGRMVVYRPFPGATAEQGSISYWYGEYVFVRYGNRGVMATTPTTLDFLGGDKR